jgi:Zn-dependent protease with chaperone function
VSRLFVWLTRRVLWVLMMIGHAVSSFMLRQMEFDADRYETRVAGSDAFAATSERLRMLGLASAGGVQRPAGGVAGAAPRDDLALLVGHRDANMPPRCATRSSATPPTPRPAGFDTHPCDAARIKSSRARTARGCSGSTSPATELFTDF